MIATPALAWTEASKPPKNGTCRFGRQSHFWGKALTAALRSNYDAAVLPDDLPKWVMWCSNCGRVEACDD